MAVPQCVTKYLKQLGYSTANPMADHIEVWRGWYQAQNSWYQYSKRSNGRRYKIERTSCHPARMACIEWASLLIAENFTAAADSDAATDRVHLTMASNSFRERLQGAVERGFALGTAGLTWRLSGIAAGDALSPDVQLTLQRYDADSIIALTYDEDSCSEAAFVSAITTGGKTYTQLQLFVVESGTYRIRTAFFDKDGKEVALDGMLPDVDTRSTYPPFALITPAVENPYAACTPYGVSVFDDAMGAVKVIDSYFDNLGRDVVAGQMMVFLSETLLAKDDSGKTVVPREEGQQFFVLGQDNVHDNSAVVKEWAPNLRVDQNRSGLETALQVYGIKTGFGADYWALDSRGSGLKTATEVVSNQSQLYRTMRKHENLLGPAIKRILRSMLDLEQKLRGADYGTWSDITIHFDDSIIEDSDAERKCDREDVAMGVMSLAEYRAKWYGEDETAAQAAVAAAAGSVATAPVLPTSGL